VKLLPGRLISFARYSVALAAHGPPNEVPREGHEGQGEHGNGHKAIMGGSEDIRAVWYVSTAKILWLPERSQAGAGAPAQQVSRLFDVVIVAAWGLAPYDLNSCWTPELSIVHYPLFSNEVCGWQRLESARLCDSHQPSRIASQALHCESSWVWTVIRPSSCEM
jgi:hypothetical protein